MISTLYAVFIYVTVFFNGYPVTCLVDSGSSTTIVRSTVAANVPARGPVIRRDQFRSATGSVGSLEYYRIANAGTRDLGWNNVEIAASSDLAPASVGGPDCIMGMNLLGLQPVILDRPSQRVRHG